MIITLSGHIGSGKSTVASILSELTGYRSYSGGYFFRKKAGEMNLSIADFNTLMETDATEDRKLNKMIGSFMTGNNDLIVESRLAGWIAKEYGISAFRVFLEAPMDVRIQRIQEREGPDKIDDMVQRENSENRRFMEFFGYDMDDTSIYDAVIDTTEGNADYVAKKIYRLAFSTG